jgi:hypothetical protein
MKVGPDDSGGANQRVTAAYSPPPPARKPVWPLQASPGWDPSVARTSRSSLGICPQFCTCSAVRPGGGSPSFRPEKTQIEFACAGPAVGFPLPVTSPANAELAPTTATTTAQSAAASNDLKRIATCTSRAPGVGRVAGTDSCSSPTHITDSAVARCEIVETSDQLRRGVPSATGRWSRGPRHGVRAGLSAPVPAFAHAGTALVRA